MPKVFYGGSRLILSGPKLSSIKTPSASALERGTVKEFLKLLSMMTLDSGSK
jgi:hypothetical protein